MCYVCVEYVGAFVNAALGLLGWLWCVLRLRGIRGRVCERRAWFAGMVVVCVTFAWNTWARLWTPRLVCRDDCGMRSISRIVKLV